MRADWSVIGEFTVDGVLGRGASSTVYRVRRTGPAADGDSSPYALKLLDQVGDRAELASLTREASLLASVDDPALPAIHVMGEHEGCPYLVMDLLGGTPLGTVLGLGPLPVEQVLRVALDVIGPLTAAHRRGLVHRDLKPDNIMILRDGQARLIDFGLATQATGDDATASTPAVGTLLYSAPEQTGMLRRAVDHRSDLYALGAVLFECLAGVPPFPGQDAGELLRAHAAAATPDLRDLVAGVPAGLAAVVTVLLAKDPDDRYQDGAELAADLAALAELIRADPPGAAPSAHGAAHRTADAAADPTMGFRPRSIAFGPPPGPPMVGRTSELADLMRSWSRTVAGFGRVCLIRGEAGSGKSRLAAAVATRVREAQLPVLHGKASPDDAVPLAPLRAALERYLGDADRLPDDARDALHAQVREVAGPAAPLLRGLGPALGGILAAAAGQDARSGSAGTTASGQDQFIAAVADLFAGLARAAGGMLLVLDDVQWADSGTQRVLGLLPAVLGDVPLMVVGTARTDPASQEAADALAAALGNDLDLDLTLGPLTDEDVADLVAAALPRVHAGPDLAQLLAVRGQGNPFVVQEYLRAIIDAGLLRPAWGTWELDEDGLNALALPQDALGLVLQRVDNLGQATRDVLHTAAAAGTAFDPDVVATVHDLTPQAVHDLLLEAVRRRLVEPRATGYAFLHDRIREALLDPPGSEAAQRLHLRLAQAMDAMDGTGHSPSGAEDAFTVAHHWMAAGRLAPAGSAFTACRRAGERALDGWAPAQAVQFLEYAASLGEHDAVRAQQDSAFWLALASALKQDGELARARQRLEQALPMESDPYTRAELLTLLADVHRSRWNAAAAMETVAQGLAELKAPLPRTMLGRIVTTLLMFAAAGVLQRLPRNVARARGLAARRCALVAGLHEVGSYAAVQSLRPDLVIMHNLRVLFWVGRIGQGTQYARSQGTFGFLCGQLGLLRASRRAFARSYADPASQDPSVRALLGHYQGAAMALGHHDNGETWAANISRDGRWLEYAASMDALSLLAVDAVGAGRTREALQWAELAQRRQALHAHEVTPSLATEALILSLTGRPVEAAAALSRFEDLLTGQEALGLELIRLQCSIAVLRAQNEIGEPFDRAAARFEAVAPAPALLIRPNRLAHFHIAMSRLEQVRAAGDQERRHRLAQARHAVRTLSKATKSPELRTRARIGRADLLVVEGKHRAALRVLDKITPIHDPDQPMLAYETARVRARALFALGGRDEAARQEQLAAGIARDHGWTHQATWVTQAFGRRSSDVSALHGAAPSVSQAVSSLPRGRRPAPGPSRPAAGAPAAATRGRLAFQVERERLAALEQVGAAAARVVDPGELARIALDEVIRVFTADRAVLFLIDDSGALTPHLGRAPLGRDVPELTGYSTSLVDRVAATRRPLVVTGTEEGVALGAQSVVLHGLRSIMVAPLLLEGRLLGVVYLDSRIAKGVFGDDDVSVLIALTNHIATSLETARAAQLEITVRVAQQQRDLADLLREALLDMTAATSPDDVLTRLPGWAERLTGCPAQFTGPATAPVQRALCLPLEGRDGPLGALTLTGSGDEHREVASTLVAQAVTAFDRASLLAQVQALASADELTGIPNRRHFFDLATRNVTAALRTGRPLTAAMVDIDHFKSINDTHGHPTGDDVIREVATRLAGVLRTTDLIGRYGGEEFAVLLMDSHPTDALTDRLRRCIADSPVHTRSGPLNVTVSIGATALRSGDDGLDTVLARADQGLYQAKHKGRNRVELA